jgi:uroporphyrinogen-III decarboxylase
LQKFNRTGNKISYFIYSEKLKFVKDFIRKTQGIGAYILAPSHAIQGGTPPENIIAFLEEAGRYPVELGMTDFSSL